MEEKMHYGTVCSGIEAPSVAVADDPSFEHVFFSEIDKHASAVLRYHWPEIHNYGDFTEIERDERTDRIQLLVGGPPCQAFSLAGLRGGATDPRGNLTFEFVKLLDRLRPRWILYENVPGLRSSWSPETPRPDHGEDDVEAEEGREIETSYEADETADFDQFIAALTELGYGVAWRSLDAQYAGVAQRRERVFVVGYFRDMGRPSGEVTSHDVRRFSQVSGAVLFDLESVQGHPAPSKEARQGPPPTSGDGAPISGPSQEGRSLSEHPPELAGTLGGAAQSGGFRTTDLDNSGAFIPGTIRTPDGSGSMEANVVEQPIPLLEIGKSQGGSPCGDGIGKQSDPMYTLQAGAQHGIVTYWDGGDLADTLDASISAKQQMMPEKRRFNAVVGPHPIAFSCKDSGQDAGEIAPTLRAMNFDEIHVNGGGQVAVAFEPRYYTRDNKTGGAPQETVDLTNTHKAGDSAPVVAFNPNGGGSKELCAKEELAPAVTGSHAGQPAISFQTRVARNGREGPEEEMVSALTGASAGATSDMRPCVSTENVVRRLTPIECERLMAFEDDHTKWGITEEAESLDWWDEYVDLRIKRRKNEITAKEFMRLADLTNKLISEGYLYEMSDTQRYRQVGNSMCTKEIRWLMQRIKRIDDLVEELGIFEC